MSWSISAASALRAAWPAGSLAPWMARARARCTASVTFATGEAGRALAPILDRVQQHVRVRLAALGVLEVAADAGNEGGVELVGRPAAQAGDGQGDVVRAGRAGRRGPDRRGCHVDGERRGLRP